MKKWRTILIDDEKKVLEVLRIKLEKHCPEVEVIGWAHDVDQAEELIRSSSPDIIFLDISMPSGTGFDLIERFESYDFQIIFCTGYSEYAVQAFKLSAVDYLLKPLKTGELKEAVAKAIARSEVAQEHALYRNLIYNMASQEEQSQRIAIPGQNEYEFVTVSDIIRCEGWEKYTRIHLEDGRRLLSSYNIGRFRENLEQFGFYSCHKSHLVNKRHISKYLTEGMLIMSNGHSVPVSRRKREQFISDFVRG